MPAIDKSFRNIRHIITQNVLFIFLDFTKKFTILPHTSKFQLGLVIVYDEYPLAFYSRKLTPTQRNYTIGE